MITTDITSIVDQLNKDEIVAIPTETVYGLAGNIYSETAIKKIFALKKRPFYNPLIIHIKSSEAIYEVAEEFPVKAKQLAEAFWPGPLTLVLKKKNSISDLVTGGNPTAAIRVPNHPLTLELLNQLDFPIAAPSANPFGSISPTTASHVEGYFSDSNLYVLDGGNCKKGVESTIIGFENNEPILYRLGPITLETIEKIVGKVSVKNKKEDAPEAPGMLSKHYAPKTKTVVTTDIFEEIEKHKDKKIGVLTFMTTINNDAIYVQEKLTENNNYQDAAQNLYAALHRLDSYKLELIIIEKLPELDLGITINDRLQRAAQ